MVFSCRVTYRCNGEHEEYNYYVGTVAICIASSSVALPCNIDIITIQQMHKTTAILLLCWVDKL